MALVVKDRVKETTTTTGTGTITLLGAVSGYQAFSVIGDTNTTYYAIVDSAAGTWEVGIGTYTASGTLLSRDTILESSSGGSAISFAAGTKDVFCTYPAERSMYVDGTTITPATAATLPVVSGGTGAATLTANNVLLGNGTSALQVVAPGTTGNVLTSNGTTWTSSAAPAGAAATPTALGTVYGKTTNNTASNTTTGFEAGNAITTAIDSTFLGNQAGKAITTGSGNVMLGSKAGLLSTNHINGVVIGTEAASNAALTEGHIVAIGYRAGYNTGASSTNAPPVYIGKEAGFSSTGNNYTCIAIGSRALYFQTTGYSNVAIGSSAGFSLTTAIGNTFIGRDTAVSATGSQNTTLGAFSGTGLTTGANNIIIGYNATASAATVSNETTIGNSSTTSARIFGDLKFLNSYTEVVFAVTGTTPALSPTNGSIQTWTLSGNSTPTAGTWAAGQSITLMIDDGSAFTVTWSSLAVTWKTDAGSAPTLNTTGFTAITLWKVGAVIYGARVGDA